MPDNPTGQPPATQAARRAKYGLNVAVALLAALGIVALVNVIAYKNLKRLAPLDLTATGQYSLAPQTKQLLKSLQGEYRIVTLFGSSDPQLEPASIAKASDLIDQYARYSSNIRVDHISADMQTGRVEELLTQLQERYTAQLTPLDAAIKKGQAILEQVRSSVGQQRALIGAAVRDQALPAGDLRQFLQSAMQSFSRLDAEIDAVNQQIKKSTTGPMPAYGTARENLENLLSQLDEKVYAVLIRQFATALKLENTPAAVKDKLLALREQCQKVRTDLQTALTAIRSAQAVPEYDQLREAIQSNPNSVILIGPKQVKVLWLGKMFRQPDPAQVRPGEQPELLFQGEERITGALVSMTLDKMPLVVFVTTGRRPVLGPGGEYDNLAQRLQTLSFEVKSWNPQGAVGPMGQPTPPGPPPEPEPDQKAVWILLPAEAAGPMDMTAGGGEQQAVEIVQQRLAKGDAALLIVSASPTARFGGTSPVSPLLDTWGITAQLDKLVLREVTGQDGRTRATPAFDLSTWATDLPISTALAGMPGIFVHASPLTLAAKPAGNIKLWPLVRLTAKDMWAERDYDQALGKDANVHRNPKESAPAYVIAAAAQRDNTRLVVVADQLWANDYITTNADPMLRRDGVGLAEYFGAAFPANAELFVNSVEWLSGLDQLIAASARTQDIRRVRALTPAAAATIQWSLLAGLPLLILAAGLLVWIVRRKG